MARPRPRGLLRLLLGVPPTLYRVGLAGPIGRRALLLTTRGRKSGLPRRCALNYAEDGERVYVVSGFGSQTDWYRNLRADPRVDVRIGRREWRAHAATVTDPAERRRALSLLKRSALRQGPPRPLRPLLARLGLDYDAELAAFDSDAAGMPVVSFSRSL